jgi:hypothetical protein
VSVAHVRAVERAVVTAIADVAVSGIVIVIAIGTVVVSVTGIPSVPARRPLVSRSPL